MGAGNKYICKKCGMILQSMYRHDFVECSCGCFVDGGDSYTRMGWPSGDPSDWIEEVSE